MIFRSSGISDSSSNLISVLHDIVDEGFQFSHAWNTIEMFGAMDGAGRQYGVSFIPVSTDL